MREAGRVVLVDPGSDTLVEFGTLQCVHCGHHFMSEPGSGNVRGFCMNCAGPVCGPGCVACVPVEQLLENLEAGRPADFRRVFVPVRG